MIDKNSPIAAPVDPKALRPFHGYSIPDFVARGFYLDQEFDCAKCGIHEVWTAKAQKWWYEVARRAVYSEAKYCGACRKLRRGKPDSRSSAEKLKSGDPRTVCRHLRQMIGQPPSEKLRAEVEGYLAASVPGIQSIAAEVLCSWGGRKSMDALRNWVRKLARKPSAFSLQNKAARMIATCLGPEDEDWTLDLFFSLARNPQSRYWLSPLFAVFHHSNRLLDGLTRECALPTPAERIPALNFLAQLQVDGRDSVYRCFVACDETERWAAKYFLENPRVKGSLRLRQWIWTKIYDRR